jgi:uncharacterized membrane protein HdeD (DUF308 family)
MPDTAPMAMCPMAATCKGMMEKPRSGLMLMIPGFVFIIFGVAVLIEPQILVWLVAVALVMMGIAMLMMAGFMRRMGHRLQG